MAASAAPSRKASRAALLPRLLSAAGLAVSSYLHVVLAQGPLVSGGQVTLAGLFLAQAVVAGLVALWLLVRPSRTALLAALVVGAASLTALVLSVYVQIPSIGPFPVLYEPVWYAEKVGAAVAAAVATAGAAAGLTSRAR